MKNILLLVTLFCSTKAFAYPVYDTGFEDASNSSAYIGPCDHIQGAEARYKLSGDYQCICYFEDNIHYFTVNLRSVAPCSERVAHRLEAMRADCINEEQNPSYVSGTFNAQSAQCSCPSFSRKVSFGSGTQNPRFPSCLR